MPVPSEGPGACLFYLPNIIILLFYIAVVVFLLVWALNALINAWRQDDESRKEEQRNLIVTAVLAGIKATRDYDEAMKHNEEYRREDEERNRKGA